MFALAWPGEAALRVDYPLQLGLSQLAHGVARQAIDKHDAARVLVARQSSLEELKNGLFMQIFFLADDAGARGLAPFRVVDADHRRLGDGRSEERRVGKDV